MVIRTSRFLFTVRYATSYLFINCQNDKMMLTLMLDHTDEPLQGIHHSRNPVRLDPVKMTSPFDFISNKIKISQNSKDLGNRRDSDTQKRSQFFRRSPLIAQQGKNFVSGWIPQRTTDPRSTVPVFWYYFFRHG